MPVTSMIRRVRASVSSLRRSGALARDRLAAIEAASDGIGIVGADGRLVYMNRALMALHGIHKSRLSDFIGRGWENLYSEKGRQAISEKVMPALRRDGFWRGESPIVRTDGAVVIAEMSLTLLDGGGFIGTARDITAQKNAEAEQEDLRKQFVQAQKMEAVGRLTGGIAHDFNNLLTVIAGNLELLDDDQKHGAEKQISAMRRAVARGAELTQRLLAFSRQQVLKPQVVNTNDIIPETIKLIRRAVSDRIEIFTKLDKSLWETEVDTGQLENALLNLAINARDAMQDGGRVSINTENTVLSAQSPERQHFMDPGNYVVISVADSGAGIPPEVLPRVFEPFFTTKEAGKGSGLGLSMVFGFVKQSGGYVTIDSTPGKGTAVRLYFPRAAREAKKPAARSADENPAALPRGTETVLIVEDEQDILDLTSGLMKNLGYAVHAVPNGAEAVLLMEKMEKLDLLLTDIILPGGIDGVELSVEARTLFPKVKVLFVSGYTHDALSREKLAPGNDTLLQKPYSREILARTVREVLNSIPSPALAGEGWGEGVVTQ